MYYISQSSLSVGVYVTCYNLFCLWNTFLGWSVRGAAVNKNRVWSCTVRVYM